MEPTNDLAVIDVLPASQPANDETADVPTIWLDTLASAFAAGLRIGVSLARTSERDDDDVITVEDVAALHDVGRNAVYESVGRNEIPHRRIGKQIRFSRRGIMRWLASWSVQDAKEGT